MKNRNAFFYIIIFLALLTVAALIFLLAPGRDPETPAVHLSTPVPAEVSGGDDAQQTAAQALAVTPDTVQTVIATLHRAESYSRRLAVRDFWSGGSRSRSIDVFARGGSVRLNIAVQGKSAEEYVLLRDGEKYLWYSDDSRVFRSTVRDGDEDAYQSILTYEKVLSLPVSDILDAGYEDYEGTPCIFVRFRSTAQGYESVCWIDPAAGLLMGERCYDGETLIYSMDSSVPEISTPDEALFAVP